MNAAATVGVEPKRADIEGLRAVAILLVVLAHAGVPRLAGGFVGVDVFFVISGYLITGILVRAAQAPRSALVDFYARRLRRLLPALLVVQLVSIALAMLLLAPQEQLTQIAGARAAVLWVSNFQFALSEIDYFGESAENALFLHTWSLSVEEQFYLVWPLLIFLAMGVWRRGGSAIGQHRARYALALLAACGLIVPLLQTPIAPLQAYYLLPARFWQFALGGLLMLWQMRASARLTLTVAGARWAVAAGLGLVGASAFMLDGTQPYPGAWAIAPTLGTAAVLAAGFGRPSGVTAMLAAAPMQWVGRHSYGWYLWHWPLLLLGRALAPAGMALGTALGLMALALALAVASQRWIEAPIRYSAHLARRPGLTIALAMSGMAFGLLAAQAWESVAGNWAQRPQQAKYFQNDPKHYELYARGCDVAIRSSELRPCSWGRETAPKTVVLVGDSVAMQWFSAMRVAFPETEWRMITLTKSACPMVDAPYFYRRIGRRYVECETWRRYAVDLIVGNRPDVVVVGSAPTPQFDDAALRAGTRRVLERFATAAGAVFVLSPTPTLPFEGAVCAARQAWRPDWLPLIGSCVAPLETAGHHREMRELARAAESLTNVHVLNFDDLVCPQGECRAMDSRNGQVFRDSQHLSGPFVRSLGPVVQARLAVAMDNPSRAADGSGLRR